MQPAFPLKYPKVEMYSISKGFLMEDRIERYSMEDNIRDCDGMHDMHH